jgi:hypothetical protein
VFFRVRPHEQKVSRNKTIKKAQRARAQKLKVENEKLFFVGKTFFFLYPGLLERAQTISL